MRGNARPDHIPWSVPKVLRRIRTETYAAWLKQGVSDDETLSEFISYRHERMKEKLPMLTGGIEKLGALPIVIALYLQFKDMHWPPHPSWVEIFLIFVLVLGYWLSVLQISVRLRLQFYETLLRKALQISI